MTAEESLNKKQQFHYDFTYGDFDLNRDSFTHTTDKELSKEEINKFMGDVLKANKRMASCNHAGTRRKC